MHVHFCNLVFVFSSSIIFKWPNLLISFVPCMLIKNRAENCVIKAAVGTNISHFCEYSKSHEMRIFL